jgi:hypothetical protein
MGRIGIRAFLQIRDLNGVHCRAVLNSGREAGIRIQESSSPARSITHRMVLKLDELLKKLDKYNYQINIFKIRY